MSAMIYIIGYLAIAVFLFAVISKVVAYLKNPIHVRWDLYPVAHEPGERASYGGSYLEDVEWWKKERKSSKINELKVMIPEILFLKAVHEYNRGLWYVSFPFHFGLYMLCAFIGLLFVGAGMQLAGMPLTAESKGLAMAVFAITNLLGPAAFFLSLAGALGLFFKRMTDSELKTFSSFGHFFNLAFFIIVLSIAIATWLTVDPTFVMLRGYIAGLISFSFVGFDNPLFTAQIISALVLAAYIPMTHMSHFFMKYFLYHDIRWGDEANIDTPETDAKIGVVLNYPITWAAEHIRGDGSRKTWAEVATFNPQAEPEKGKE